MLLSYSYSLKSKPSNTYGYETTDINYVYSSSKVVHSAIAEVENRPKCKRVKIATRVLP